LLFVIVEWGGGLWCTGADLCCSSGSEGYTAAIGYLTTAAVTRVSHINALDNSLYLPAFI
jgi:hypothetical protein